MNKLLLSLLLVRTLGWCQDPVEAAPASPPKPDPVFKVGSGVSAPALLYKVEPNTRKRHGKRGSKEPSSSSLKSTPKGGL
jgi:hypothetical protein